MKLEEIDLTDADFFLDGDPHEAWTVMRAQDPIHWDESRPRRGYRAGRSADVRSAAAATVEANDDVF